MRVAGFVRGFIGATALCVSVLALAQSAADDGWPSSERLLTQFRAGNYATVIAEAPATLRNEPWNNELKLAYASSLLWTGREWEATPLFEGLLGTEVAVEARLGLANALAWSGRMSDALPHYRRLAGTPKGDEAKLGMANALRWMGRDDLALPFYEELRVAHPRPMSDIGEEGLFFARRAVRARTTLGFGYQQDNTPTRRREPAVSHVWRDASKSWIFGVEASGGEDWNDRTHLDRREYGLRVEALEMPLSPRFTLSRETDPRERTFADLRLQLTQWPLYVHAGRVNFGKLAFTVPALEQGLTATRFGVEGQYQVALGELRGYANHFRISDDNRISNADLRLATRWRPLGREVKPIAGIHWRRADQADPDYWSPQKYVLGYFGLEGEWVSRYWSLAALATAGFKIAGEAGTTWAGSVVAKRWLGDHWAVGLAAFAQKGTRASNYRAEGATLHVERIW